LIITIEWKGGTPDTLAQKLNAMKAELIESIVRSLNKGAIALQSYIVDQELSGQLLNRISGNLANSVRVKLAEAEGDKINAAVEAGGGTAYYAAIQNYGSFMAYEILPTEAKALRFLSGGSVVFAKRVIHPPIHPTFFMEKGAEAMEPTIVEYVAEGLREVLNKA
jgi:hypothetical protein